MPTALVQDDAPIEKVSDSIPIPTSDAIISTSKVRSDDATSGKLSIAHKTSSSKSDKCPQGYIPMDVNLLHDLHGHDGMP